MESDWLTVLYRQKSILWLANFLWHKMDNSCIYLLKKIEQCLLAVHTMTLTCKTEYISTYNTFVVSFHRDTFPSSLGFVEKTAWPSIHYGTDTLIFTDAERFFGVRQNEPLCVRALAPSEVAVFGRWVSSRSG